MQLVNEPPPPGYLALLSGKVGTGMLLRGKVGTGMCGPDRVPFRPLRFSNGPLFI